MIDVILVNFHCVDDLLAAAGSVVAQSDAVQLWLVDNSCNPEETSALQAAAEKWPAQVLVASSNLGFGQACNWAFSTGKAPYVLLLNPDTCLENGALQCLRECLDRDPVVAAAGPAVYWDQEMNWRICSSPLPSPWRQVLSRVKGVSVWRNFFQVIQRRKRLAYLRANHSLEVENLSGGHVLLRRSAVVAAGGLFDQQFFMYFEDTDLFLRLRRKEYKLVEVVAARIAHFYEHHQGKNLMMEKSEPLYFEKNFSRVSLCQRIDTYLTRFAPADYVSQWPVAPVNPATGDIELPVPAAWEGGWLLELGAAADFSSAIVLSGRGIRARIPFHLLSRLEGGCLVRLSSVIHWWSDALVYRGRVIAPELGDS